MASTVDEASACGVLLESMEEENDGSALHVVLRLPTLAGVAMGPDILANVNLEIAAESASTRSPPAELRGNGGCLRLQVPGLPVFQHSLEGYDVDAEAACASKARWRRRDHKLLLRVPLRSRAVSGSETTLKPATTATTDVGAPTPAKATANFVPGSGGVLLLPMAVFDPTHQSSQAMMRWMRGVASDNNWLQGQRVLDYGCGSGILGLVSLIHGATRVVAVDLDRRCLHATRANAVVNDCLAKVSIMFPPQENRERDFDDFFGDFEDEWQGVAREAEASGHGDVPSLSMMDEAGSFGCVVANMRKNALVRNAWKFVQLCAPGGVVAVSGFMVDFEEAAVVQALRAAGLQCNVDLDAPTADRMGDFQIYKGYGVLWGRRPLD